jgi:hypothetical protein
VKGNGNLSRRYLIFMAKKKLYKIEILPQDHFQGTLVELQIDHQGFGVGFDYLEEDDTNRPIDKKIAKSLKQIGIADLDRKTQAKWLKRQLGIALDRLIEKARKS